MLKVSTLASCFYLKGLLRRTLFLDVKEGRLLSTPGEGGGEDVMTWVWGHMVGKEKARMDGGSKRYWEGPTDDDGWMRTDEHVERPPNELCRAPDVMGG